MTTMIMTSKCKKQQKRACEKRAFVMVSWISGRTGEIYWDTGDLIR